MSAHEPDRDAAAYVTGTMTLDERERFEAHLLTCETCWREVQLDREGRALAESAREAAPAALRETVRAAVVATAPDRADRPFHAGIDGVIVFVGSRRSPRCSRWW